MVAVAREKLESATAGYEKTWLFRVSHRGEYLNLTSATGGPYTITAKAKAEATAETDLVVTVTNYTQAGEDVGLFKATIASGVLTAARAGEWLLNFYIAASGGNAQPLGKRKFTLEPKETEA